MNRDTHAEIPVDDGIVLDDGFSNGVREFPAAPVLR